MDFLKIEIGPSSQLIGINHSTRLCLNCSGQPSSSVTHFLSCLNCSGQPSSSVTHFLSCLNCSGQPSSSITHFLSCLNCSGQPSSSVTHFLSCLNCSGQPSSSITHFLSCCLNYCLIPVNFDLYFIYVLQTCRHHRLALMCPHSRVKPFRFFLINAPFIWNMYSNS